MIKVIGFSLYGQLAASNRVRLSQYREGLLRYGIELHINSILGDEYLMARYDGGALPILSLIRSGFDRLRLLFEIDQYHAAIVHCELLPFVPAWLEQRLIRVPYIYDFDDAWYLRYQSGRFEVLRFFLASKFDHVMKNASFITAGNRYLANRASSLNRNIAILPSAVDTDRFRNLIVNRNPLFTVGWIGSASTEKYLESVVRPVNRAGLNEKLRFLVIGGRAPVVDNAEVCELVWSAATEVTLINSFDVGIMPLPNNEWAQGKCAYKLVQYMACGLPVIASRVGANVDLVTPDCGILVDTEDEWFNAIMWMRHHPQERSKMGLRGRMRVELLYSLESNLPVLANVIKKVSEKD